MVGRARMSASDRQEQLLRAGVASFAKGGYGGTTADHVARRAGVSQPYVLRFFGSKHELFLAVCRYASEQIQETFRKAAATVPPHADVTGRMGALRRAYLHLARDEDLLLVLQHGFMATGRPELGPAMRRCFTEFHDLVVELTGADDDQVRDFVAHGLLTNTIVALRMRHHVDAEPNTARLIASMPPRS